MKKNRVSKAGKLGVHYKLSYSFTGNRDFAKILMEQ